MNRQEQLRLFARSPALPPAELRKLIDFVNADLQLEIEVPERQKDASVARQRLALVIADGIKDQLRSGGLKTVYVATRTYGVHQNKKGISE